MQNTTIDITGAQADALNDTELSAELKEKIRVKYFELAKQFPKMKRHRLMRKACEFYHVKVDFVK